MVFSYENFFILRVEKSLGFHTWKPIQWDILYFLFQLLFWSNILKDFGAYLLVRKVKSAPVRFLFSCSQREPNFDQKSSWNLNFCIFVQTIDNLTTALCNVSNNIEIIASQISVRFLGWSIRHEKCIPIFCHHSYPSYVIEFKGESPYDSQWF